MKGTENKKNDKINGKDGGNENKDNLMFVIFGKYLLRNLLWWQFDWTK